MGRPFAAAKEAFCTAACWGFVWMTQLSHFGRRACALHVILHVQDQSRTCTGCTRTTAARAVAMAASHMDQRTEISATIQQHGGTTARPDMAPADSVASAVQATRRVAP